MDRMPSSEFRKQYANIQTNTLVTVNGHVIGQWTPMGYADEVFIDPDDPVHGPVRVVRDPRHYQPMPADRPAFRPVPKPVKRK